MYYVFMSDGALNEPLNIVAFEEHVFAGLNYLNGQLTWFKSVIFHLIQAADHSILIPNELLQIVFLQKNNPVKIVLECLWHHPD